MAARGGPVPGAALGRAALAVGTGLILHLAYPRPGWDLLGWVGLTPVLWLAATAPSPRVAFAEGWVAGFAFFVALLRWLTHTMTTYSTLPWPGALFVLASLAAYLALYWGVTTALLAWLTTRLGAGGLWLAPAAWVAGELARTHLLTGFPWGLLGYIPYQRLPLIQLAAWTGVYGVSALLALVNTAATWALLRGTLRALLLGSVVAGLAVGGAWAAGQARLASVGTGAAVGVALVQGNIDQRVKWDRAFQRETLAIYGQLTRQEAPEADLIVWPEAAVPVYLGHEPWALAWLTDLAGEVGRPLLVGAPDARLAGRRIGYRNSAFLVSARGIEGRYDKIRLVPFGEYVPWRRLFFFVEAIAADIGDFTPGDARVIFPFERAPFGTVICYEIIFPNLVRDFVDAGARFMVNLTNDAWFGDTGGPLQHLAMVPLRAVENGVAVVRAANTGVSALVAPSGAIGPRIELGKRGAVTVSVPPPRGPTFYTRHGDLFAYGMGALTAAGAGLAGLAGRRERACWGS